MLKSYPRYFVLRLIELYQKTLSRDHGWLRHWFPFGACRFQPTCSEYTYQAVSEYGFIKGGLKGIWRILRCNPWAQGGFDPLK
jgi:uncharacterized protein